MSVATATPVAASIEGRLLAEEIRALGTTHVLTVPDTCQKSVIERLATFTVPKLLYVCTEDEAIGINAGLYITGHKPLMLIQNNGLFACLNTLKAISLDSGVPTCFLIGQFGRDVNKTIEENPKRMVHRLEPTLETWGVPFFRLEGPADLGNLRKASETAWSTKGPAAAIIGAPTS